MPHNHQKKIAVINDFCGFGRCSLAVSIPIISAMKVQCCPLPTSVFSNHTGFESFYYTDFTRHMESYADEWEKLNLKFSGILTGFLGSPTQIGIVEDFLRKFKSGDTITVIDPVMGDYGNLYPTYSPELARKMKNLVPYADMKRWNRVRSSNTLIHIQMNGQAMMNITGMVRLVDMNQRFLAKQDIHGITVYSRTVRNVARMQ